MPEIVTSGGEPHDREVAAERATDEVLAAAQQRGDELLDALARVARQYGVYVTVSVGPLDRVEDRRDEAEPEDDQP